MTLQKQEIYKIVIVLVDIICEIARVGHRFFAYLTIPTIFIIAFYVIEDECLMEIARLSFIFAIMAFVGSLWNDLKFHRDFRR